MNNVPKRCLIVDDEYYAIELIENYLQRLGGYQVVDKLRNPLAAFRILESEPIDLLFLDIQMPQLNGLVLLNNLQSKPATIFTTAYSEYAHKAFDLEAVDYLVKPFSFERFSKAVGKAERLLTAEAPVATGSLQVRSNRKWINIPYQDILYIEGWKEYVRVHCTSEVVTTLLSMQELEEKLPAQFVRIHRSFIVARQKVTAFSLDEVVMENSARLPVARNRREVVAGLKG